MTTFNYSTGDPTNLTGGATANMADISGPFADLKTFVNGGNIDTTNLATSAKPATLMAPYMVLGRSNVVIPAGTTSGTYWFPDNSNPVSSGTGIAAGAPVLIALTPSEYAVSGLTTSFRLRATLMTNGTAPAITFTSGLYPATASGGPGLLQVNLGTVVSGSTVARASPTIGTMNADTSSAFTISSTGVYAFGVVLSGTTAANSRVGITFSLEVHWT